MTDDGGAVGMVLSDQLNRLFEVQRPNVAPDKPWTNRDVVTACKQAGHDLSESHLSELRRGVKRNPTLRTLTAIAWFFEVRVGYFTDPAVNAEISAELDERERCLHQRLEADRAAQGELRDAAQELQQALRDTGVTKMAHRYGGAASSAKERAAIMRNLAHALTDDDDDEEGGLDDNAD